MIGPGLDRIGSQMVCTSANYMSLAAANEEIPIPQVPLGPSLNWVAMLGGLDIGELLGGQSGGPGLIQVIVPLYIIIGHTVTSP